MEGIEILNFHPWEKLEEELRNIRLLGDPTILPYQNAKISLEYLRRERVNPLSFYALFGNLEFLRTLRGEILKKGHDILNQTGILEFEIEGKRVRMSPPIVEVYTETQGRFSGQKVHALVDGEHRFILAEEEGVKGVMAVVISGAPEHLPLVSIPLSWEEVRRVEEVPPTAQKRLYRFPTLESFPDVLTFSRVPITQENFLYFFYRDLSTLGSSGIRKPQSQR